MVAGALLCFVGSGNWIAGRIKLSQYERLAVSASARPAAPLALGNGFAFTSVSEAEQRHRIVIAKVEYYSVVLTAGQILVLAGLIMLATGYLRTRSRPLPENKTLLDSA